MILFDSCLCNQLAVNDLSSSSSSSSSASLAFSWPLAFAYLVHPFTAPLTRIHAFLSSSVALAISTLRPWYSIRRRFESLHLAAVIHLPILPQCPSESDRPVRLERVMPSCTHLALPARSDLAVRLWLAAWANSRLRWRGPPSRTRRRDCVSCVSGLMSCAVQQLCTVTMMSVSPFLPIDNHHQEHPEYLYISPWAHRHRRLDGKGACSLARTLAEPTRSHNCVVPVPRHGDGIAPMEPKSLLVGGAKGSSTRSSSQGSSPKSGVCPPPHGTRHDATAQRHRGNKTPAPPPLDANADQIRLDKAVRPSAVICAPFSLPTASSPVPVGYAGVFSPIKPDGLSLEAEFPHCDDTSLFSTC